MTKAFTFTVRNEDGMEVFSATGRNGALKGADRQLNAAWSRAADASGMLATPYYMEIDGKAFPHYSIFYLYPRLADKLFDRMERDGLTETLAALDAATEFDGREYHDQVLEFLGAETVHG